MKRVLIVNDQETSRHIICLALNQAPGITLVGEAENGLAARGCFPL